MVVKDPGILLEGHPLCAQQVDDGVHEKAHDTCYYPKILEGIKWNHHSFIFIACKGPLFTLLRSSPVHIAERLFK